MTETTLLQHSFAIQIKVYNKHPNVHGFIASQKASQNRDNSFVLGSQEVYKSRAKIRSCVKQEPGVLLHGPEPL